MEKLENQNLKKANKSRDRIIKRLLNKLEKHVRSVFIYDVTDDVVIEEMMLRIFYRIVKLYILDYSTIIFIYYRIMSLEQKDRPYALLKIYLHLKLQKLSFEGIITSKQLKNIFPNEEGTFFQFIDEPYILNFGYEFYNKCAEEEELLDEDILWALFYVAHNLEINEDYLYVFYDTIQSCDKETVELEIKNLIVRLRIRDLCQRGVMTEDDETYFMSKIQEYDLTYDFFTEEEIERWKSKAIPSVLKIKK